MKYGKSCLSWAEGWEALGQRVERALSSSHIILSGYIMNVSSMCTTAHTAVVSVPHVHPSGLHRPGSRFSDLVLWRGLWKCCVWFDVLSLALGVRSLVCRSQDCCLWRLLYVYEVHSSHFAFSPRIPRQHCHVNFGEILDLVTVLGFRRVLQSVCF